MHGLKEVGYSAGLLGRSPTDSFGSIRARPIGRDRSFTARHGGWQGDWPLCVGSPTFKVARTNEVEVGLMAVSVSSPIRFDRQQPLRSGRVHAAGAG